MFRIRYQEAIDKYESVMKTEPNVQYYINLAKERICFCLVKVRKAGGVRPAHVLCKQPYSACWLAPYLHHVSLNYMQTCLPSYISMNPSRNIFMFFWSKISEIKHIKSFHPMRCSQEVSMMHVVIINPSQCFNILCFFQI